MRRYLLSQCISFTSSLIPCLSCITLSRFMYHHPSQPKKGNGLIRPSFHALFGESAEASNVQEFFDKLHVGKKSPPAASYQPAGDSDNASRSAVLAPTAVEAGGGVAAGFSGAVDEVPTRRGGSSTGKMARRRLENA